MKFTSNSFGALCTIGILARLSYALARTPVLPLFALYLGAGPEVIGWVVGLSTVTGILLGSGLAPPGLCAGLSLAGALGAQLTGKDPELS